MVVHDQNMLEFAVSDKRFDKKASKYGLALLIQVKGLFCTDLQTELSWERCFINLQLQRAKYFNHTPSVLRQR